MNENMECANGCGGVVLREVRPGVYTCDNCGQEHTASGKAIDENGRVIKKVVNEEEPKGVMA